MNNLMTWLQDKGVLDYWQAKLSFVLIIVTLVTSWYWLWGLLMIFWAFMDLIQQQTWLSEPIVKDDAPVLFYLILVTWLGTGLYFFSDLFFRFLA